MPFKKKTVTERKIRKTPKAEKKVLAPSSEAHRVFLNCKSNFVIFGGGKNSASALKTIL